MNNIRIKNVSFSYNKNCVFKNINFYLPRKKNLSIIGPSASGKTTLLKLLDGQLEYSGEVFINGIQVSKENKKNLKSKIRVVYNDYDFITDNVLDEINDVFKNFKISSKEQKLTLKKLNDYFEINKILKKRISSLNLSDKTLLKILLSAIVKPNYIAIDDILKNLNNRTKILLLNYFNSENIMLINVTSDIEDCLYTDYTLCLYNKLIAIDGKTLEVFKEEKLLKRIGLSLPFMIDLSIQLQLYGLINKIYLNKEALVKKLWK